MKRRMAEALLAALLLVPAAVSSAEAPREESCRVETSQEQEDSNHGKLPGSSPAEGELPGSGNEGVGGDALRGLGGRI